ncbi:MAG: metallophosphoesterase [Bacteroidota bacterium]
MPLPVLSMEDAQELIRAVEMRGYGVVPVTEKFVPAVVEPTWTKQDTIKIGLVSDTHFGSLWQQPSALDLAYDWFKREKVTAVLHAGDLCDGSGRMHKGMAQEQFLHNAVAVVDYVVNVYPKAPFTTFMIGGNHDLSYMKEDGVDVPRAVSERRKDIVYLGNASGTVQLRDFSDTVFELQHPDGAAANHLNKVRTYIDRDRSPDLLPNVMVMGHLHRFSILPEYRGVLGIEMPAFQGQTSYLERRALYPNIGAVLLTLKSDGSVSVDWKMWDGVSEDF